LKERELDAVLQIIENPVRRRIIKRLAQEPSYALLLSKELGLGQPLVAKHLALMEKAGIVTSALESSPSGPERRRYSLAKSISITMDVAPHLFKERAIAFNLENKSKGRPFSERVDKALSGRDDREKLASISELLGEIDTRIGAVEEERVELLAVRNDLMNEAAKIVAGLQDLDMRRVIFHILEEHDREVASISQSLDMREVLVKSILDTLERDIFG
jgi:predicted transcriptional regulator